MNKIVITIVNSGNAAFDENEGAEVARILREIARRIDEDSANQELPVRDLNGNTVGDYKYLEGK